MSARTVNVTLNANVSGFVGAMGRAASSVDQFTGKMSNVATKNASEWDTVGSAMTRVGAVAAAGLGAAVTAAIQWESAFAGVKKTVEGTPEQMDALEDSLRGMARTMATSHQDIAAVAEAAGQLGVATPDVARFTETMIMLGETTNLSAEQAATSLAQFMNIMGTAPSQVEALGSALVGLGNNSATTESQILGMGQRIAAAGTQIGMSEGDVLGFAAAVASTGVEVEAGGTAVSMTMAKMAAAVREGGTQLELMASTAGMSAAEFKRAFETDAAGAIASFVEGLGKLHLAGGDMNAVLTELGITGQREADTIRRLALSGDLLRESLTRGNDEFAKSTALMNEYGERAATTESKVRVAWNNIKDAAISAGSVMLPAVAGIAEAVAAIASAFGALPAPVQAFLGIITAVVAAVGLFGGAAMKAIAGLASLRAALVSLGALGAVTSALGKVGPALLTIGRYAVPAAAALAGIGLAIQAIKPGPAVTDLDDIADRLRRVAQDAPNATQALDKLFQTRAGGELVGDVDSLATAFERFGDPSIAERIAHIGESIATLGMADTQLDRVTQQIDRMDEALTNMSVEDAAIAFRQLGEQMSAAGVGIPEQIAHFDDYAATIDKWAASIGVVDLSPIEKYQMMMGELPARVREAAAANGVIVGSMAEVEAAAGAAAMSISDYSDALLALSGSENALEQAVDDVNEALAQNGANLDRSTKAGRDNWDALDKLASAGKNYISTLAEQGTSEAEQARLVEARKQAYLDAARAMGLDAEEAQRNADAHFATVAPNLQAAAAMRALAVEAARGSEGANAMAEALGSIPPNTEITITADGMAPVVTDAGKLREELAKIDPDKIITVTMPNGKVVTDTVATIEAGLVQAEEAAKQLGEVFGGLGEQKVTLTVDGVEKARTDVEGLRGHLEGMDLNKEIVITLPDGTPIRRTVGEIIAGLDELDKKQANPKISAETGEAKSEIQSIAQQLSGIDDKVVNISAPGVSATRQDLEGVADAIKNVPDDKPVTIRMMNGKEVEFTAGQIRAALELIQDKNINVTSNAAEEKAKMDGLQQALMDLTPDKQITVSAPGLEATKGNLDTLKATLDGMPPDKPITITLPGAEPVILTAQQVRDIIDQLTDKNINVTTTGGPETIGMLGSVMAAEQAIEPSHNIGLSTSGAGGAVSDLNGVNSAERAIEDSHAVNVTAPGAGTTTGQLNGVNTAERAIDESVTISVSAPGASGVISILNGVAAAARAAASAIASVGGRADGGYVSGRAADGGVAASLVFGGDPGPEFDNAARYRLGGRVAGWSPHPRADNVPAWLTAGEIVQSNRAGDMYGRHRLLALNAGKVDPVDFAAFMRAQGFAAGGQAGTVRDAFRRPATVQPVTTPGTVPSVLPGPTKTVTQNFTYNYPIGERESTATRRAAAAAATEAMF